MNETRMNYSEMSELCEKRMSPNLYFLNDKCAYRRLQQRSELRIVRSARHASSLNDTEVSDKRSSHLQTSRARAVYSLLGLKLLNIEL